MFSATTDDDYFAAYNGSAWVEVLRYGAWNSWTPALTQTSATPTYTIQQGGYALFGKTVLAWFSIDIASVSGSGTGNISLGLPVNHVKSSGFNSNSGFRRYSVGRANVHDASVQNYHCSLMLESQSSVIFGLPNAAGAANFALATNDCFAGTLEYESA